MRLTHLSLHGYYGFRELEISFPAHGPTVLIGRNGAGKSTVLDAVAMFLAYFARAAMSATGPRPGALRGLKIAPEEVHLGARSAHAEASFVAEGRAFRESALSAGIDFDALEGDRTLDFVREHLAPRFAKDRYAELPALAYYRPNRAVGVEPGGKVRPPAHPQLGAYINAFGPQVGPFHETLRWFRAMEDQENEERLRRSKKYRNPRLSAVRKAIERFMSALAPDTYRDLRVERHVEEEPGGSPWAFSDESVFVIDKGTLSLPLDSLSDGERGALLLVADLATRLVMTHPGSPEPLHGAGIALVDELELHLHPGWQRRLVPALGDVFPNVQIIATTHSPQVLSMLHPESVVVLKDFKVEAAPPTFGKDSNTLLCNPMGEPARPEELARKLAEAHVLIDREQYREAEAIVDEVARDLGELDPEIVRLRVLGHIAAE